MTDETVFDIALECMCCVMFSDGKASKVERAHVQDLIQRAGANWSLEDVDRRVLDFFAGKGHRIQSVVNSICDRLAVASTSLRRTAVLNLLDKVIAADGTVDPRESALREKIANALSPKVEPPLQKVTPDILERQAMELQAKGEFDTAIELYQLAVQRYRDLGDIKALQGSLCRQARILSEHTYQWSQAIRLLKESVWLGMDLLVETPDCVSAFQNLDDAFRGGALRAKIVKLPKPPTLPVTDLSWLQLTRLQIDRKLGDKRQTELLARERRFRERNKEQHEQAGNMRERIEREYQDRALEVVTKPATRTREFGI